MGYQFKTIQYDSTDGVCTIALNRPQVRNALNRLMLTELSEAVELAKNEADLRLVILKGNGPGFCAGADLSDLLAIKEQNHAHQYAGLLAEVLDSIETIPVPVITLAQGTVYGGGLGFLAVSDFVIAADDLRLAFSELRLGLIPAVVSSYVLRKAGIAYSRTLMLSARDFNSVEALDTGLVSQVVKSGDIDKSLNELVQLLLKNAPEATRSCKKMLNTIARGPHLEAMKEHTRNVFAATLLGEEAQTRLKNFTGKSSKKADGKKKIKK
jgi:methylglutaconyl-CoA hydratase